LRAYAFVEASFTATAGEKIVIAPAAGVVSDGLTSIVFLVGADGHSYSRRPVKLGRRSADKVEILEGLHPGDRIVTRGALLLLNALVGSK
jgi:multidrug efflux pump subunit AcrA (membrane-fusion protein)